MKKNKFSFQLIAIGACAIAAALFFCAPPKAFGASFLDRALSRLVIIDESLKATPGSALAVQGGTFGVDGWTQKSINDYLEFDTRTLCRGEITFDVKGIDQNSIDSPTRGSKYFGSLFSMYDEAESGMSQDPEFFQGACYDSSLSIGGSEEKDILPKGKTCADIAQGRTPLRQEGKNVCVFDSSPYLRNDLILRQNQGKEVDNKSSKQSDGDPYDVGNKIGSDSVGKEPLWSKNQTYHVALVWEAGVSKMKVTRSTSPPFDDRNIIDLQNPQANPPSQEIDTFITDNKKGEFRPGLGRLRLGNSAALVASGIREGDHGIPGAIFSNLKVVGRICTPDYSSCPTVENASCADPAAQEDLDLFSGFNPDKPPDPLKLSFKPALGLPPIKAVVRFNLAPYTKGTKEATPTPDINVHVLPQSPKPNEEVNVIAENQNFSNENSNPTYTTWCVDNIFQGGAAAGGSWATETTDDQGAPLAGPCCRPITRTPAKDADVDGMDDDWEAKYFPGVPLVDIKPEGNEDANPDGDGCVVDKPVNEKGQSLVLAPKVETSTKKEYILGKTNSFPNILEYIFGTDPTDPDTDADGVDDECDILGKNQTSFEFSASKKMGEAQVVRATTVGRSLQFLTKIESKEQKLFIGAGGLLEVSLQSAPANAKPGDSVTVTADVSKGLAGAANIDFQWKMRKPVHDASGRITGAETIDLCAGDNAAKCGLGKNSIVVLLPPEAELQPNEYVTFSVQASETSSNRRTKKELQVTAQGGASFDWGVGSSTDTSCAQLVNSDKVPARGQYVGAKGVVAQAVIGPTSYVWNIDGIQVRDARARGDLLCFRADKNETQVYKVGLVAVDERGVRYEAGIKEIRVGLPEVSLSADPANPAPGARVKVTATPENFSDNAAFSFTWSIDGVAVEDISNQIEFNAGARDQVHRVKVQVSGTNVGKTTLSNAQGILLVRVSGGQSSLGQGRAFVGQIWNQFQSFVERLDK